MEIHVDFTNNHFEMSFIPVDFYSLESTFGHLPIHQIKNLNLGFFPDDDNPQKDCYYDNKDIYKIFPHSAADLKPLFNYLKEIEDRESYIQCVFPKRFHDAGCHCRSDPFDQG